MAALFQKTAQKSEQPKLPKLVVLLGSTASGKTDWSLHFAKEFNGQVISADSRQVFKRMDIGTAKPPGEWRRHGLKKLYMVDDVIHHLVDILDPGKTFTAAEYRDRAIKHIKQVQKEGKTPFLVGGTGLYISSIVDNFQIPRVQPNKKLRSSLEEKSPEALFSLLQTLDPLLAETIDKKNKRRLIRALEVCIFTGEPFSAQRKQGEPLFDVLQIGISVPRETLYSRIEARIDQMIEAGLLQEVEELVKRRYNWKVPSMNGIGYRQFEQYFSGACSLPEVVEMLKRDTKRFARRQHTWFKRDPRIQWYETRDAAADHIHRFLIS